jgi:hydroxypyruvate reductase
MKNRTADELRADALAIWLAGVAALRSDRLVREALRIEGSMLTVDDQSIDLSAVRRIVIVGAGKAGAGMAAGAEQALGPALMAEKQVTGWVNVPADCIGQLERVRLHAARPAGVNEPTVEGVAGSEEILRLVAEAEPADLCLCLISGGASALLPAPVEGVTLADKRAVTRHLSGAGANMAELNTVRKQLSRIKGGGLLRACRAGHMITLVISDVLGDPLDLIASGPTVPNPTTAADAWAILERYDLPAIERLAPSVVANLREATAVQRNPTAMPRIKTSSSETSPLTHGPQSMTVVIGNNAVAVDAAGVEAERRGYSHAMLAGTELEPSAEEVGVHLATMALQMRDQQRLQKSGPDCLITGGEPVVKLAAPELRGRGGRNQQLVLAALEQLALADSAGIAILSGGTDGEDGPTDAAGAIVDAQVIAAARAAGLDWHDYLRRNDAYNFFAPLGALIKTGPTHTNVCDVRVVVVGKA